MKIKSNCSSSWVNLACIVFTKFFKSHSINMNDQVFFYHSRHVATAFVYIACMTCFLISGSKKAMMQFFWVWFLKLKQQDTRVNCNKDSVIQMWAEKRKKQKKTEKRKTDDKLNLLQLNWSNGEKQKQVACVLLIASFLYQTDLSWKR